MGDDVTIWNRLLETPYDDVRLALIADLNARTRSPSPDFLRRGKLDNGLLPCSGPQCC